MNTTGIPGNNHHRGVEIVIKKQPSGALTSISFAEAQSFEQAGKIRAAARQKLNPERKWTR